MLHVCTVNGRWIAAALIDEPIACMAVSRCGAMVVSAGAVTGQVVVRAAGTLEVVATYDAVNTAATVMAMADEDSILVGLEDGRLLLFAADSQFARKA